MLQLSKDPRIDQIFADCPSLVRGKMQYLRELVIETAKESKDITELRETLKWGEPTFVTKVGSPLRIAWKSKNPNQYAMCFQCKTRLVDTFRLVFGNTFQYEGSRAIIFDLKQTISVAELKECIRVSLTYHRVKKLMALGL